MTLTSANAAIEVNPKLATDATEGAAKLPILAMDSISTTATSAQSHANQERQTVSTPTTRRGSLTSAAHGPAPSTVPQRRNFDDDSDGDFGDDSEGDAEDNPRGIDKRTGRRKIKIEYIEDKSRRHITFSKRKAGIMKKAYELSTLTGTQVLLLVASETGHVYTFATPKLQPLITKPEGKNLIQACLNAPETPEFPGYVNEQTTSLHHGQQHGHLSAEEMPPHQNEDSRSILPPGYMAAMAGLAGYQNQSVQSSSNTPNTQPPTTYLNPAQYQAYLAQYNAMANYWPNANTNGGGQDPRSQLTSQQSSNYASPMKQPANVQTMQNHKNLSMQTQQSSSATARSSNPHVVTDHKQ